MDNKNGTASGAQPPTARHVTLNQVVAWNVAHYRKLAGLTQAQLGDRIGWTNTAVSEAEKSLAGKRTRKFDAQTTAAIAIALGVPMLALYLPPEDDGITVRYLFSLNGTDEPVGMDRLVAAIMPDNDDKSALMESYRARILHAVRAYLEPDWADDVARWLKGADEAQLNAELAERLRYKQAVIADLADEIGELAERLEKPDREDGQ